jgi:hypothetical protein
MADANHRLTWRAFAFPKEGHCSEEMEDTYAADAVAGRFAVADGVSESAFAGAWAQVLTGTFVRSRERFSDWLPMAQEAWLVQCQRPNMPWYIEDKFEEGAYATFLGVFFRGPLRWHASAVGDCCLFHVREGRLVRAFPVGRSKDFGTRPPALRSRSDGDKEATKYLHRWGRWREGDVMMLATDALAHWFLRQVEEGEEPWKECLQLESQAQFADWVRQRRQTKEIRNDDTTLMVIQSAPK